MIVPLASIAIDHDRQSSLGGYAPFCRRLDRRSMVRGGLGVVRRGDGLRALILFARDLCWPDCRRNMKRTSVCAPPRRSPGGDGPSPAGSDRTACRRCCSPTSPARGPGQRLSADDRAVRRDAAGAARARLPAVAGACRGGVVLPDCGRAPLGPRSRAGRSQRNRDQRQLWRKALRPGSVCMPA